MNKLPVFRTFGRAVGFTLWNFLTIFRLSWFPLTLLLGANFAIALFTQHFVQHGTTPSLDPISINKVIQDVLFINLTMMVLEAIVVAAVAVSIHRIILFGDRKPGVWLNFPFGGTEFRYVLMGVVSFFIILAALAAVMAPALYLLSGGDIVAFFGKLQEGFKNAREKGLPPGFLGIMLSYALAWIFALYFVLRLFVWPPAIVATRRFALGEAWGLTRGNVWRLFGLCALVFFVLYFWVAGLAGAAYWYYTSKMKVDPPQDPTHIIEAVQTVPTVPNTAPPKPSDLPTAQHAGSAPTTSQTKPTEPTATAQAKPAKSDSGPDAKSAPPTTTPEMKPAAPPPTAAPPINDANDDGTADEGRHDKELEKLMAPYRGFFLLFWFSDLIFYMLATAFGVALLSYSYKALKGYEIYEPIPDAD